MGVSHFSLHQPPLRAAITAHDRAAEPDCLKSLLAGLQTPPAARALAESLILSLRQKNSNGGAIKNLVAEYDLSSQEGIALMCLAEALLRIPDTATRDALIRDKIGGGNWRAHLGHSPSLFVNAATWGLVVTGKLTATIAETGLSAALKTLIARGGEPLIRKGVDLAMRLMGEQFVTGETIHQALKNARLMEAKGFTYSYDMLGEAAATARDAARYLAAYETAIAAIGAAAQARDPYENPGISIKLSALHPRYTRLQRPRVMAELLPRLKNLALRAKDQRIGFNIDAEESDRLDLSLDLMESLCLDPELRNWNGLGFVVQAYQKRAPYVLDWLIDLARRSNHRLMIRLVKGAYWDSEIKRAQMDGLEDFPVFTRKLHTDISYLACAQKMLAHPAEIFPQFATHNAHTLAAIFHLADPKNFRPGQYEFQCLHGMGEPLYEDVIGPETLNRPCRIYAPVGTHETLLAYLVRRLLENGANASFVNRIRDPSIPVAELSADPVATAVAENPVGRPHPAIRRPEDLFAPTRRNAKGLDLSNESCLRDLAEILSSAALPKPPALATQTTIDAAIACATKASWPAMAPAARAKSLLHAADLLESRRDEFLPLLIREAGKTIANAAGEIREAVDFLRYHATQSAAWPPGAHTPLGPIACISPWNFPLAIFTGQIAAALAAGNTVLAKPAPETPIIAAQTIALLHEAGIPPEALHLLPGDGNTGATLIADPRIAGVVFTGSTATAKNIQKTLATRLSPSGAPIPLIAETGGQNAMIVDSSALPEQVVADILASAFDSAGQRCSALRVLYLQDDIAERILAMLKGAIAELTIGDPQNLDTDIGPVISKAAQTKIELHIAKMQSAGKKIHRAVLPKDAALKNFVAPSIIEIDDIAALTSEIFGPILHVIRYPRDQLDQMVKQIAATGYALTFGIHSRIDETIARITKAAPAGNIYVNRNIIGAVVGVQPFGGHSLSGTGPKAGGPIYLRRLLATAFPFKIPPPEDLPGPVGERNTYSFEPRGTILCLADTAAALNHQIATVLATGNRALIESGAPATLGPNIIQHKTPETEIFHAVLFDGSPAALTALNQRLAAKDGPIIQIHTKTPDGAYAIECLLRERVVTTNTTAAGGNANLLMLAS